MNTLRKQSGNDDVVLLAKGLIKSWKKLLPGIYITCRWRYVPDNVNDCSGVGCAVFMPGSLVYV